MKANTPKRKVFQDALDLLSEDSGEGYASACERDRFYSC